MKRKLSNLILSYGFRQVSPNHHQVDLSFVNDSGFRIDLNRVNNYHYTIDIHYITGLLMGDIEASNDEHVSKLETQLIDILNL